MSHTGIRKTGLLTTFFKIQTEDAEAAHMFIEIGLKGTVAREKFFKKDCGGGRSSAKDVSDQFFNNFTITLLLLCIQYIDGDNRSKSELMPRATVRMLMFVSDTGWFVNLH